MRVKSFTANYKKKKLNFYCRRMSFCRCYCCCWIFIASDMNEWNERKNALQVKWSRNNSSISSSSSSRIIKGGILAMLQNFASLHRWQSSVTLIIDSPHTHLMLGWPKLWNWNKKYLFIVISGWKVLKVQHWKLFSLFFNYCMHKNKILIATADTKLKFSYVTENVK
jgi:hypothetical protein